MRAAAKDETRFQQWSCSTEVLGGVQAFDFREGMTLILSNIEPDTDLAFEHVEPADVLGIGFHLKGQSWFDMQSNQFVTKPFDVYASAAPRGSRSSFVIPAHGFQTVSLRFAPEAAKELMMRHGIKDRALDAMIGTANSDTSVRRMTPLRPAGAAMIQAMFASPYSGAGRSLFLESCALALLAAQIQAGTPRRPERRIEIRERGLSKAKAHLDAHLDDPPSIVQLARIVGINDFELKRAFKATYGTTIFGYVRQRRLERAAVDLHAGLPVAQAAAQAGYECPRCFSDAFRRQFGTLPSQLTRSALPKTPAHLG